MKTKKQTTSESFKPIVGHNIGPGWWYACGVCKGKISNMDKKCPHCGRGVKWGV